MAIELGALVRKEIAQLQEAIAREESVLTSLKADLKTREAIERMLAGGTAPSRPAKPAPAKRAAAKQTKAAQQAAAAKPAKHKPFDWEAALKNLPDTFTTDAAAQASAAGGMSRRQAAMAVARWIKAGRIKKLMPGKYRKA